MFAVGGVQQLGVGVHCWWNKGWVRFGLELALMLGEVEEKRRVKEKKRRKYNKMRFFMFFFFFIQKPQLKKNQLVKKMNSKWNKHGKKPT